MTTVDHTQQVPAAENGSTGNQFFTTTTLFTLAGATMATTLVVNTAKVWLQLEPGITAVLAFVLAQLICIVGALTDRPRQQLARKLFVAVLNGFLVFTSASGMNNIGAAMAQPDVPRASAEVTSADASAPSPAFWSPWP